MPDPTEEEPPTEEEFLELILRGEGGQPRRPIVIAMGAVLKARSDSSVAHIPVAAVVTGRLLDHWDEARETLAGLLEGMGLYSGVDYLSPEWAEVKLLMGVERRVWVQPEDRYRGTSLYVRFVPELKDWRLARIGVPGVPVDQLATS